MPETLGACAKLEHLNLSYNVRAPRGAHLPTAVLSTGGRVQALCELPPSIMALSWLEHLDLTKNGAYRPHPHWIAPVVQLVDVMNVVVL